MKTHRILTFSAIFTISTGLLAGCITNNEEKNVTFIAPELMEDDNFPVQIPVGFDLDLFSDNVEFPTSIAFPPDGTDRLFVNELNSGKIRLFINGEMQTEPFLDLAAHFPDQFPIGGSRGLTGLVFDPDYETNRFVYISYATSVDGEEKGFIARMRDENNKAVNVTVLLDEIPSYQGHQVQNIIFGRDGMLYASVGDAYEPGLVQDATTMNGKILRMTKEGAVPPDNPFGPDNYAYALGFRNAYDLIFNEYGDLLVVDNGDESNDTFYSVAPGDNAGWPVVEGVRDHQDFIRPIYVWDQTSVPVDLHYYRGSQFSSQYHDKLFLVLFGVTSDGPDAFGKRIQVVDFQSQGDSTDSVFYDFAVYQFPGAGNPLDLAEGPDGSLYFSDAFQGMIYRIEKEGID